VAIVFAPRIVASAPQSRDEVVDELDVHQLRGLFEIPKQPSIGEIRPYGAFRLRPEASEGFRFSEQQREKHIGHEALARDQDACPNPHPTNRTAIRIHSDDPETFRSAVRQSGGQVAQQLLRGGKAVVGVEVNQLEVQTCFVDLHNIRGRERLHRSGVLPGCRGQPALPAVQHAQAKAGSAGRGGGAKRTTLPGVVGWENTAGRRFQFDWLTNQLTWRDRRSV
jgi:hypothetical protein